MEPGQEYKTTPGKEKKMKLEQLRPNLLELPINTAYLIFLDYTRRREIDLKSVIATPTKPKVAKPTGELKGEKKKREKKQEITVSQSELQILKQLGLL